MGNDKQGAIRRQIAVEKRQTVCTAFASRLDEARTHGERKTTKKPEW